MQPTYSVTGGIKLPKGNKLESTQEPITSVPLPPTLIIPLRQNYGTPPKCVVHPGERVLKGQMIASPNDLISSTVHAPTSGIIETICDYPIPHPSGLPDRCVILKPDGKDEGQFTPMTDWQESDEDSLRQAIREAGIVGLGGAVFPADVKIHPPTETLVINGAECEPYITCDDMLMQSRANDIVAGALILKRALGASRVMFGIEEDKPQAIEAIRQACQAVEASEQFSVHVIPARYPSGYAKQLIYLLTGITIPVDVLPYERGVQCFNVGTTYSVYRAIILGEPQISRIVTVTGNVEKPKNYEVRIGTPIDYLLTFSNPKADTDSVVMGGPMMGFPLADLSMPIIKASACLLVTSPSLFPRRKETLPCIRCGACVRVCPVKLMPYQLMAYARNKRFDEAQKNFLFDCIECGCCSYVCPSNIPLVHYFKYAKGEIRADQTEKQAAEKAKYHFEKKKIRLEQKEKEKAARLAKRAAPTQAEVTQKPVSATTPALSPSTSPDIPAEENEQAAIQAALERVKQRRAAREEEEKKS